MSQIEMWDLIPELKPPEEKQHDYFVETELYSGFFEWRRVTHEIMINVTDRNGKMIDWVDACRITDELGYIRPTRRHG